MLGSAFRGTLREAQAGDEQAFTRLWRDANPLLVRYLRVIGAGDPYDAACEGWLTAIRGLTGYSGDEAGWRVWLLACARLRAEQDSERERWATVTPIDRRAFSTAGQAASASSASSPATAATAATSAMRAQTDDDFDIGLLLDAKPDTDPEHRGLGDTITALRTLPLGQGEILVLRLAGGLPLRSVSDVVGSDADTVRRSEARALERLGAEAELITWSLDAPATSAELADERVALGAFRSIPRPPAWSVPRTRVVTIGRSPDGRGGHRSHGIANAAGRSRSALLGIAMVSASVMSIGGLSAAAYVGALPTGVQEVMHRTIGAPAPGATRGFSWRGPSGSPTASARPRSRGTPVGPDAASTAAVGLCRAWDSEKAKGTARESSLAFRNLASTAGGAAKVDSYCATVAADPASAHPTAQATTPATGGKPTTLHGGPPSATKTVPVPQGTGSPGRTPSTSTNTKAPNTHSPTKAPVTTAPPTAPSSTPSKTKGPGKGDTKTRAPGPGKGSSAPAIADPVPTIGIMTPAG